MPRYACRVDSNHREIVRAFERLGCSVADLSRVGSGVPDLLVAVFGQTALVEVKTEKGALRDSQEQFLEGWKGRAFVVRTVDDVIEVVRALG